MKTMVDPFNMYLENINILFLMIHRSHSSTMHLRVTYYFINVFDAYKRCLSYCFSRSVDKCAFSKPFWIHISIKTPSGLCYTSKSATKTEKQKDFKNVISFRVTFVSTGQLYKL